MTHVLGFDAKTEKDENFVIDGTGNETDKIQKSPEKSGLSIYNSNKNYTFFFSTTTSAAAPNGLSFAKSTNIGAPTKIEE